MKLLLDTHFVLSLLRKEIPQKFRHLSTVMASPTNSVLVSVASLWEIAIKTRLGKLNADVPMDRISENVETYGATILDINRHHVLADIEPAPPTRDPFDRLLLAQCQVEALHLVTVDRALIGHPLAWRATA